MHVLTHFSKGIIIETQDMDGSQVPVKKHLSWISFEHLRESHQTLWGAVNVAWCRYGGWGVA